MLVIGRRTDGRNRMVLVVVSPKEVSRNDDVTSELIIMDDEVYQRNDFCQILDTLFTLLFISEEDNQILGRGRKLHADRRLKTCPLRGRCRCVDEICNLINFFEIRA